MVKVVIPVLLLVSSIGLASCGNPAHSKAYEAGVAWVRNDFPGTSEADCLTSVLNQGPSCAPINPGGDPGEICASNAATFAIVTGNYNSNYNSQQWVDGCASVPFKHYPKWLLRYFGIIPTSSNGGSSTTQSAPGASEVGPTKGGTSVGSIASTTTSTTTSTTKSTTKSTTTSTTTTIAGGSTESTTTTTTSNNPAILQQIGAEFTAMGQAIKDFTGGSGTSGPVISDGQEIQDLVGQLSGNYPEFYCSGLSQDVGYVIDLVPDVQAQDPNAVDTMEADFFSYGEIDEQQCV